VSDTTHDIEHRLGRLERELRLWRVAGALVVVVAAIASCEAPSEELSELDLVSADGLARVHLSPEGMRMESGGQTATYAAASIVLGPRSALRIGDEATGVALAPDGLTVRAPEGALGSVRADAIRVARGPAHARISLEGADAAALVAAGEHASATLGSTASESSMALRGPGEPRITALVQHAATVSVAGEAGAVRVYGSAD